MFNVGPGELIAILALALIVLGPNRLPEAVRTVGRVVGELRRISSGFQDELRNALDDSEVERDLDRLRATGDGRDGEGQRELPLDDQPELPLGSVQYPSGFEPIDVDTDTTAGSGVTGDGPTATPPTEPTALPGDVGRAEPTALPGDVGRAEPTALPGDVGRAEPTAVAGEAGDKVEPTAVADGAGEPVDLEEPDKDPAIDDDPDEPYEPPAAAGGGERAVS